MKYFCMPSDFKNETIDKYNEINNKYNHSKVIETFGQLAPDTVFGSCRGPKGLPEVDRHRLEDYVKYCNGKGIDFDYVINATCMSNEELTRSGYKKIKDFLEMLEGMGVGWVTISLPSLMEIAMYISPNLKIKASTVCQINSPHKAKFYEELGIKRIVLDEDIYREFNTLKSIRKVYSGDLEVIVNSFCVNDCPFKMFHYNSFSHSHTNTDECAYFSSRCMNMHIGAENYMKLNWIRPEDIHYYFDTGICYFKVQGRTNVYSGNPAKAVTHYIEEHYDGDLISLLELFSSAKPLTIANCEIDNSKLDGFFEKYVKDPCFCTKICSECGYCKSFAEKSISKTDTSLLNIMGLMKGITKDAFVQEISKS
jgi:collagenase-like PrtC family protease